MVITPLAPSWPELEAGHLKLIFWHKVRALVEPQHELFDPCDVAGLQLISISVRT